MKFFERLKSFLLRLDNLKVQKSRLVLKILYFLILKVVNIYRWSLAFFNKGKLSNLNEYFSLLGIFWYGGNEGHTQQVPQETEFLKDISKQKKKILEIGFNGGHSSETFLESNEYSNVDSIDIGFHHYVKFGKYFLKNKFPKRFELFIGKSSYVLPKLIEQKKTYDLIFIDGSHLYEDVVIDLELSKKLSNKDTLLILDDVYLETKNFSEINVDSHNSGPTKAWLEYLQKNIIQQKGFLEFSTTNTNKRSIVFGNFI